MRRKMGKRLLILLMSVALVSANTCFVYAEEENSSSSSESSSSDSDSGSSSSSESSSSDSDSGSSSSSESSSSDSDSGSSSKSESSETKSEESKSDDSKSTESESADTESTESESTEAESTDAESAESESTESESVEAESTDAEDADAESTESESAESESVDAESTDAEDAGTESADSESTESENTESESAEAESTKSESDDIKNTNAEEIMEEENSENVFLNKAGEEIVPSKLVGTDYTTIAEGYDGETNVIKQYATSDEYAANAIMESYVDENGNLIMVISQGSDMAVAAGPEAENAEDEDSDNKSSSSAPTVDGSFSGWEEIPVSYEYNWDNSANCWQHGVWVDGQKYTTEEGTYSTDVRHGMQMYTDEENVYLNITFAREFSTGQKANGNDYQFWVDGQMAAYQVEWADGTQLANSNAEPGTYQVDVRHRDSSWSYVLTDGAVAYYHVNEGNVNNQLELRIPLEEFVKQNGNINLDNYSMIQFYTPNLMSNKISAAGSPTGSVPFAVGAFLFVPASYIWLKKKNEKGVALA